MAFTPESHAKSLATQAANRERKAAGLPPLNTPKKGAAKRRGRPRTSPSPTITLTPPTVTASTPQPDPGAPSSLMDPGTPPDPTLHRMLMLLFGPINYLLHNLGGFDLVQEEADLILIPAERILIRRGLAAHGQLPPDLFDGIQIATGVLLYGVRLGPQIAAKRSRGGSGHGSGHGSPRDGNAPRGGNQTPGPGPGGPMAGGPWSAITPESIFDAVGNAPEGYPANGHRADPLAHAYVAGQPGSGSE